MSQDEKTKAQETLNRRELLGGFAATASALGLSALLGDSPAEAQQGCESSINCAAAINLELKNPGELTSGDTPFLKGIVTVEAERRNVTYYSKNNFFCKTHQLRAYHGYVNQDALRASKPVTTQGVASPGPTLRAKVGDTVELMFLNRIDTTCFNDTPMTGEGNGCEVAKNTAGQQTYPSIANGGYDPSKPESPTNPKNFVDKFPDCFRVSNTTNMHYHGTHTTPGAFGDNVLVGVLPNRAIQTSAALKSCQELFDLCTPTDYIPANWKSNKTKWDKYQAWFNAANDRLSKMSGNGAAAAMANTHSVAAGEWPQYWPGYYPYYFPLPKYEHGKAYPAAGQTPGTHWYHAHQHGSTSIQLLNGMSGLFLITSPDYDGKILSLGGGTDKAPKIKEKVLFLQLFSELTNLMAGAAGQSPQSLCVNGLLQPKITMKPGEVQWWRVGNGSIQSHGISTFLFLAEAEYNKLADQYDQGQKPTMPAPSARGVVPAIRQVARDGVQFAWENYQRHAADPDFQLSPGNRIDFLVQAPKDAGDYVMVLWPSPALASPNAGPPQFTDIRNQVVLRAHVEGTLAGENTEWYDPSLPTPPANYPVFPEYLPDIPEKDINITRKVEFSMIRNPGQRPEFMIDGRQFSEGTIDKVMLLNDAEEWLLVNTSLNSVMHPFHIHINPFQIVEVFDPSKMTDPVKITSKGVWQDTIAIPAGFYKPIVTTPDPTKLSDYKLVPGHIRIRHRFLDFPGKFVLHCHILGHEDRGMMQLIEVVPNSTTIKHHGM